MKYILYGTKGSYRLTDEKNYNSYIQNARKIYDFSAFENINDILEYVAQYFYIPLNNIIILARD